MMVETMLESSQDFGMANGALPQWKRELLQRRAARSRPPCNTVSVPPAHPAPAKPAQEDEDDEELRYGPGIVKRLKSRYLSLALRDAPRRRPSVLRRATSLEHLLDERPPPAPRACARGTRPASMAAPPSAAALPPGPSLRRDSVKRARSVDALSRLDTRDDHPPIPPKPQPQQQPRQQPQQRQPVPPPMPPSPPPPLARSARPPRRPTPLLRETERPPPDVVRSALRKFESAPSRRPAPAARVSAVLRGLEGLPRSSTPEPRGRSPSPAAADISAIEEPDGTSNLSSETKLVSRAALDEIARAGSSVRYAFEAPRPGSHLPPLAAANPVLLGRARLSASPRRVGVIRPMPSPALERSTVSPTPTTDESTEKAIDETTAILTPPPAESESPPAGRPERKEPPPSALVEPIPRPAPEEPDNAPRSESDSDAFAGIVRDDTPEPEPKPVVKAKLDIKQETDSAVVTKSKPLMNGHAERSGESKAKTGFSRIGAAGIERAWTGAGDKKCAVEPKDKKENGEVKSAVGAWGGGAARRGRGAPAPAATSVVFNFSGRKEVPDYIENDGIILRANRRNRFKAGEPGIVVLRPEALAQAETDSDGEAELDGRPPSPCGVRFVNDNVLINGRSSMPPRPNKDRIAKLKLQFDDSLTRTFEYPSEISLCEDSPSSPSSPAPAAPPPADRGPGDAADASGDSSALSNGQQSGILAPLAANTHLASAALARYTPSKTCADTFELGLSRAAPQLNSTERTNHTESEPSQEEQEAEAAAAAGDARPCAADAARSWSEARTHATDLLF